MMNIDVTKIKTFLAALPIDTEAEQQLLDSAFAVCGTETNAVLIVGDMTAAPFLFLPLEEQIFNENDNPPFPIWVIYGDRFSICIHNEHGETERYQTTSDFRHFCAERFAQIRACTVEIPCDRLVGMRLVYRTLTSDMAALIEAARGCNACVMVLAADAGGLTDHSQALCHWLVNERCIAQNTAVLLRSRGSRPNRLLRLQWEEALGCKPQSFLCAPERGDDDTVSGSLFAAVASAVGVPSADSADYAQAEKKVISGIETKIKERLAAEIERQMTAADEADKWCEHYRSGASALRAQCNTAKYSISTLEDDEINAIYAEINDFFSTLHNTFPDMVQNVLETSTDPKRDLRNLAGDYINDCIDAFIAALTADVAKTVLLSRATEDMNALIDQFAEMYRELHDEQSTAGETETTRFLKIAGLNTGDYKLAFISILEDFLRQKIFLLYCVGEGGIRPAAKLYKMIDNMIIRLGDALTPKAAFAKATVKLVLEQLDESREDVKQQVENTVIPRMSNLIVTAFDEQTAIYVNRLTTLSQNAGVRAMAARNNAEAMRAAIELIPAIFGTAE